MFKINKKDQGFTLIEIIVSLAVFSTVVLIILGAVLAIINLQRRTNAFRVAQENLSYAFESMVKEMRTGSLYYNMEGNLASVEFINDQGNKVFYKLSDSGQIEKCTTSDKSATDCPELGGYQLLTSPEVKIEKLSFAISGVGGPGTDGEGVQPMVRIVLIGSVGRGTRYFSEFFLQTIITQRKIDS